MLSVYLSASVLPGQHKGVEVIGDELCGISARGQEGEKANGVAIYETDIFNVCLFIAFYIYLHGIIFYIFYNTYVANVMSL